MCPEYAPKDFLCHPLLILPAFLSVLLTPPPHGLPHPTSHSLGCVPPLRLPGLDENTHSVSQQTFLEHQIWASTCARGGAYETDRAQALPPGAHGSAEWGRERVPVHRGHRGGWVLSFPGDENGHSSLGFSRSILGGESAQIGFLHVLDAQ